VWRSVRGGLPRAGVADSPGAIEPSPTALAARRIPDALAARLRLGRALVDFLRAEDALAACDVLDAEPVLLAEAAYRVLRELTAELSERAEMDETALDDAIAFEARCVLIEDTRAHGLDAVRSYICRARKS